MPRPRVPCSQSFPRSRLFVCRCLVVSPSLFVLSDAPWQETRRSILSTFAYSSQIHTETLSPKHGPLPSICCPASSVSNNSRPWTFRSCTRNRGELSHTVRMGEKRDYRGENWTRNEENKPRERTIPSVLSIAILPNPSIPCSRSAMPSG